MEDSTDPSQLPSNCTSPVCSDPAHDDDLALNAEWSDESSDCDGDGPHRDAEDYDVQDDQDDLDGQEDEEESQGVQQDLFSLSGATAPEILTFTMILLPVPHLIHLTRRRPLPVPGTVRTSRQSHCIDQPQTFSWLLGNCNCRLQLRLLFFRGAQGTIISCRGRGRVDLARTPAQITFASRHRRRQWRRLARCACHQRIRDIKA